MKVKSVPLVWSVGVLDSVVRVGEAFRPRVHIDSHVTTALFGDAPQMGGEVPAGSFVSFDRNAVAKVFKRCARLRGRRS